MSVLSSAQYELFWKRLQNDAEDGWGPRIGRLAMWPLVPLYHGASLLKRAVFASGLFPRTRLGVLTVSIGNLTMGGTGKTTMARIVGEILAEDLGLPTCVLSRGYRSANRAWVLRVSREGRVEVGPASCGDEAFLLASWLEGCSVVVGRRRAITGRYAVDELGARAVLLDDGFQYWRLERDVDLVTVAAATGFGNGLPFPRGPLREGLGALRRASCVALHQVDGVSREVITALRSTIAEYNPAVPIIEVSVMPDSVRPLRIVRRPSEGVVEDGAESPPQNLYPAGGGLDAIVAGRTRVCGCCGLGEPGSFRRTLEATGADVIDVVTVPDHGLYDEAVMRSVYERARRISADIIVMTEKDEANVLWVDGDDTPLYVLPVRGALSADDRAVLVDILDRGRGRSEAEGDD